MLSPRLWKPKAPRGALMSAAVTSRPSPASHRAILEVPPPISTFMTRADSRIERAQAPDPKAARVASSASPALTETNFPACEDQGAGVDRPGIDTGELVLRVDE